MIYKNIIRPILFRLDPEEAHDLTHHFATSVTEDEFVLALLEYLFKRKTPLLEQQILGLSFRNPVGLAAGFDKNGRLIQIINALGFGFTEIGSITANSSKGNARPRLFRLQEDYALINRMGLNNDGADAIIKRVLSSIRPSFPVGINIAKTHNPMIIGDAAIQDYIHSFKLAQHVANYITLNISCPNTEEGKTFEDPNALNELLAEIYKQRDHDISVPILVKLSADLTDSELDSLISICESYDVDGYVATNTSSKRDSLSNTSYELVDQIGRGGLSGRPIKFKSHKIVGAIARRTEYKKPIIAVGGIDSAEAAIDMIKSGAWLIQLYTGLIYEGIGLPGQINKGITKFMLDRGITSLSELRHN
jgi:dihydroorotate dehydrogenase